ncbi:bifunctional phosphoribosyl-AMP cyclohydrolase/phosphoribosyl-ATP diphosphatase HisIE [Taibaiella soli]|uniref:Histidine biosynthesis bifunctional protein HisIE n=1 Tax=Taibaiella soli TaxID=1649169 RepID=A0A2W2BKD8_9BACT|nr:bifunctional phosphoribosyl-AMP cyclohydrolase/phosphoribosyl-ATP diphosphatase HisIE [Taibaiella soli]PZF73926.1 bifunctional phosphoribosyl-AMP cyclohydrolase/phosphoribosyl-ATP diphosphatase [Taibaiella soli]
MTPDFKKYTDGLLPAIIQDELTGNVLMLGYMNESAFLQTQECGQVIFYSRSKQRLWRKGETSGNYLNVVKMSLDCDRDCLLIKVNPVGPVCHTGSENCFSELQLNFLPVLENVIAQRRLNGNEQSYTSSLFRRGINKIAQKVGEEAVELVIEAKDNNDDLFKNEAADLLFHYLILLQAKGFSLKDIEAVLKARNTGSVPA